MQLLLTFVIIILTFGVLSFFTNYTEPFTNFLFNNMQEGTRRNMSYDLRGDPYIPFEPVSPWNNPETFPIRNRQMIMEDPLPLSF